MYRYTGALVLSGLLLFSCSLFAAPEMRCRVNGAYIKVYGKNAAEEKGVCEQQGGEYTRYVPPAFKPAEERKEGWKGGVGGNAAGGLGGGGIGGRGAGF